MSFSFIQGVKLAEVRIRKETESGVVLNQVIKLAEVPWEIWK